MIFLFDDKTEPADIFSDIPSEKPVIRSPAAAIAPRAAAPPPSVSPRPVGESGVIIESAPFGKKWVVLIVLLVLVLGGAGYFLFFRGKAKQPAPAAPAPAAPAPAQPAAPEQPAPAPAQPAAPEQPAPAPAPETTATETAPAPPVPAPPPGPTVDKDTDGDGLSDGDEVLVFNTNPLKKSTDGSPYSDGMNYKNGYNPLKPGTKLTQEDICAIQATIVAHPLHEPTLTTLQGSLVLQPAQCQK